jgi:hypothetical protein
LCCRCFVVVVVVVLLLLLARVEHGKFSRCKVECEIVFVILLVYVNGVMYMYVKDRGCNPYSCSCMGRVDVIVVCFIVVICHWWSHMD